jgi:hypothetical protein
VWKKNNNVFVPGKMRYRENKVKYLKNRAVAAILAVEDCDDQKVLFELDNGYIFTETSCSPHGTDLAGLNLYVSFDELIKERENVYVRKNKSS